MSSVPPRIPYINATFNIRNSCTSLIGRRLIGRHAAVTALIVADKVDPIGFLRISTSSGDDAREIVIRCRTLSYFGVIFVIVYRK